MFAFYGIIAGVVYLIFCFLRRLFNFNLFISIPLDLICGFLIGLIFYYCTITYAFGIARLYLLLGFLIGFVLVVFTLKNFVATISNFVYNGIIKLIIFIKNKINSRRKANERKKVNPIG